MNRNAILALCLITGLAPAVFTRAAESGLVGHWTFDEGAGTVANDASGNENHGAVGGVEWVEGLLGGALEFNGSTGPGVEIPHSQSLKLINEGDFTLTAWFKPREIPTSNKVVVQQADQNGTGRTWLYYQSSTSNIATFIGGGATLSGVDMEVEKWVHAAVVITEGGGTDAIQLYVNGEAAGVPGARGMEDCVGDYLIGRHKNSNNNVWPGLIDDVRLYNQKLTSDDIARIMLGRVPTLPTGPSPADAATDLPRDIILSWTPGDFAASANGHVVYLGDNFDDVNDAGGGPAQDANSLAPGRLAFGKTYYWRVDEVNGAPDFTVYKGDTWSFTVESFSYPVTSIIATASSSQAADMGPEKTIDSSGLDDMDQHATLAPTMWLSGMGDAAPWIQFEFDRAYKLHQMLVWNSNQAIEVFVGLGAKDVTIETSVDGTAWTVLEGATLFSQATGTATYTANTTIDFAGTMAKYVRITISSGYGMVAQYGLSEVRFMFIPTSAREPQPADGATDGVDVMLAWRAGREAAQHEMVLSSDLAAVEDGSAIVATTQESMFSPAGLSYDTTYYWQINEVNEGATPTRHEGAIWSFSTPKYRVVDDFEGYNDDCDRIFFAWQDGFGHNGSEGIADCAVAPYNGNGTGSIVGHANAPFAERATVHSGKQSMPLEYDSGVSETTLTLDAQNWAANGIQALSLSFHGVLGNTGQLYLKINDVELPFDGSAAAISSPFWTQWIVELGAVATDLTRVNALTIGIMGASAPGMVYVDDIRLYPQAPEGLGPQDPGTDNLVAYYALDNNAQDGSGNGHHGTVEGTPAWISPGWDGTGACMQFGGDSDRITVESFDVTGSGITLAAWIKPILFLNDARMLSKSEGSSTADHYWAMVLSGNGENNLQFRLRTDVGNTTSRTSGGSALALDEWTHVAVAWDASDPVMRQYKNGQEIDSVDKAGSAVATGPGVKIGIGNQSVSAGPDPANMTRPFEGLMDEVRVYSRGLSVAELLYVVSGQ